MTPELSYKHCSRMGDLNSWKESLDKDPDLPESQPGHFILYYLRHYTEAWSGQVK